MTKKLAFEVFSNSQVAIQKYLDTIPSRTHMHDARVLISANGKTKFSGILPIVASIETNYSYIELLGNYDSDFYNKYTNEYQEFYFIHGTLIIKAKDRWGNDIELDISAV